MSPWTALRWTGSFWFLPVIFAVVSVIGSDALTVVTGYPVGDLAAAELGSCFACPVLAGYAALRFRGFPKFSRTLRSRRLGSTVVCAAFWPLLLAAPVVSVVGVLVAAKSVPDDVPGVSLVALGGFTVAAAGLLGIGLARALPVVLSVPLGVAAPYLWLLFTPSTSNARVHNMTAWFPACCDPETVPARGALLAALTLAVVVCLGIVCSLGSARWAFLARYQALGAILAIIAGALGAAAGVVSVAVDRPTLQALEKRHTPLVCSDQHGTELCLWPENSKRAAAVASDVIGLENKLVGWDLRPLSRVSEAHGRGVVAFVAGSYLTRSEVRYSLAAGYVERAAGCAAVSGRWREERVAFLGLGVGLRSEELTRYVPRASLEAAEARYLDAAARPDRVRAWFELRPPAACGTDR